MSRILLLTLLLTSAWAVAGELNATESAKIAFLKQQLRDSNCVFDRNGSRHSGQEAIDHIEVKQAYFKRKIDSAEKFIELSATKSTMSGKPYYVDCPGEEKVPSAAWLQARLDAYEPGEQSP